MVCDTNHSRGCTGSLDRKSTRLNSSHLVISYAVFCLKKKKKKPHRTTGHAPTPDVARHHLAPVGPRRLRASQGGCRVTACLLCFPFFFFFFNDTATTEIYTLSLHDALPI